MPAVAEQVRALEEYLVMTDEQVAEMAAGVAKALG